MFWGLLFGTVLWAKFLIVSDIDDTIKVSHVRAKTEAFQSILDTKYYFGAMPELYSVLARDLVNSGNEVSLYYLTAAPTSFLAKQHMEFLKRHGFPSGVLINPSLPQSPLHYKKRALEAIVRKENPEVVLLFGDDGQDDPQVYGEFCQSGKVAKCFSFIRVLYSRVETLQWSYIPFVTPYEIMVSLKEEGLVSDAALKHIEEVVAQRLGQQNQRWPKGAVMYTSWQKCSYWRWEGAWPQSWEGRFIVQSIRRRCERP